MAKPPVYEHVQYKSLLHSSNTSPRIQTGKLEG